MPQIVVTDTNVLINLIYVDWLSVLGSLDSYDFIVVDEVLAEITRQEQEVAVAAALKEGHLSSVRLEEVEGLALFSELVQILGRGEAASLALAVVREYAIACDEKRVFKREATSRLGANRILTTPGIFVLALRQGLISIEDADHMKDVLEANRFRMAFSSFKDIL